MRLKALGQPRSFLSRGRKKSQKASDDKLSPTICVSTEPHPGLIIQQMVKKKSNGVTYLGINNSSAEVALGLRYRLVSQCLLNVCQIQPKLRQFHWSAWARQGGSVNIGIVERMDISRKPVFKSKICH